jgi:hypothetical protein
MSGLFNIWRPYEMSRGVITFDVTPADAFFVNLGSLEFVSSCLRACEVTATPLTWKVKACRQSYYSDYSHSADWRAQWDIAWIVEVSISPEVYSFDQTRLLPSKSDVPDETATQLEEPELDFGPVVVIGHFEAKKNLETYVANILDTWKARAHVGSDAQLQFRRYSGGALQARALIEQIKLPEGIPNLNRLQDEWQRLGGVCNWRDSFKRS